MPTTAKKAAAAPPDEEDRAAHINERQMRQLHALLHEHGYTDRDDILEYLSVVLDRDVESRKTLTVVEAAAVIALLEDEPRRLTPELQRRLRAPFPDDAVGKLPRSTCKACSDAGAGRSCPEHQMIRCNVCGNKHSNASIHLDYVGHADVTDRLLSVDPHWSWRPFTPEEINGIPPTFRDSGLWIMLTVCGITTPGFGDADGKRGGNAVKEAIGDALRNAAMRRGVALELWTKGDRDWMGAERSDPEHGTAADSALTHDGPTTPQLLAELDHLARTQGIDRETISAKWRHANGDIPVDALPDIEPVNLAPLVESVKAYIAAQREAQPA